MRKAQEVVIDSIITWMGGKKALREVISKLIPDDIGSYVEPFGGAGWVLLYKDRWARMEVWNDLDQDLFNMFLQVKFHPEEVGRELELMMHCPNRQGLPGADYTSQSRGSLMNSIISWVGGKRLLRGQIIPLICKHSVFVEVFGGAAWVLFGKSLDKKDWLENAIAPKQPYTEVYNDINGELVNFWRQVKYHPEALTNELGKELIARESFDEYKQMPGRTELERAVRFYYLLGCSYGSQSKNFCIMKGHRYLPLRLNEKIAAASERLSSVIIERMDWQELIKRYDEAGSFFYLDPPYYEHERLYKRDGTVAFDEHEKLAEVLRNTKGKWLLSYNDCKEIRKLYHGLQIREVSATYSVSGTRTVETVLIISNYVI